jgi:hypothetical protein
MYGSGEVWTSLLGSSCGMIILNKMVMAIVVLKAREEYLYWGVRIVVFVSDVEVVSYSCSIGRPCQFRLRRV